jgi:segregation and condensation protein B
LTEAPYPTPTEGDGDPAGEAPFTEPTPEEPTPEEPRSGEPTAESSPEPSPEPEAGPPQFPVPEDVADWSAEELAPALAAVCFALNRPVTLAETAAILGRSRNDVGQAADHLAGTLRGGGLMLQRHQDEIQLVTRPEVAWAVQRALNPEKPGRLSRAALETLAIVAYRQPLTRAAIEAIRGVNCEGVLDSLERRGLIAEVGRQDTPGHPRLFGTTLRFLQVVGLERIEDLPPLPEGLKVPELPESAWIDAGEPTMEVRGEPVDTTAHPDDEGPRHNGGPPPE